MGFCIWRARLRIDDGSAVAAVANNDKTAE